LTFMSSYVMKYDDENDRYKKHGFGHGCTTSIGSRSASKPEIPLSLRPAPDGQNVFDHFDLKRVAQSGLLPAIYFSDNPRKERVVCGEESRETEVVELEDKRRLGIATLGSLRQHPKVSAFRRFIEGWDLSYFTPDAARSLPLAGPQKHLNIHGDNLMNVVQFMEREHPKKSLPIYCFLKTLHRHPSCA